MMNYYMYQPDSDTYHTLRFRPPSERKDLLELNGNKVYRTWKTPAVEWEPSDKPGDFPRLSGYVPVLSDRALKALANLLDDFVEVLPLDLDDNRFGGVHALHLLRVIDCLDPDKSEVERFDDGTILDIWKYALRDDVIAGAPMFRIRGYEFSHCYVSDDFRKAVEAAKLEGLIFRKLS